MSGHGNQRDFGQVQMESIGSLGGGKRKSFSRAAIDLFHEVKGEIIKVEGWIHYIKFEMCAQQIIMKIKGKLMRGGNYRVLI